jgi:hypothetical protein
MDQDMNQDIKVTLDQDMYRDIKVTMDRDIKVTLDMVRDTLDMARDIARVFMVVHSRQSI